MIDWLKGPEFMYKPKEEWPEDRSDQGKNTVDSKHVEENSVVTMVVKGDESRCENHLELYYHRS